MTTTTMRPTGERPRAIVPAAIATLALKKHADDQVKFLLASVTTTTTTVARTELVTHVLPAPAPSGDFADVKQCIKDHESGNYTESSHPSSGSGAYQFIPSTWRTWFGRWQASLAETDPYKHVWFDYAYQAPAGVQDAVIDYALHNGGASNWSPRYGDDPCTVGMTGGG